MNTRMGQNKDATVGFIGIGIIIAIIAGVVLVLLPEESETAQNEIRETQSVPTQDDNQKILLEKIEEQEKNLRYLDDIKQKNPSELDFLDKQVLENEQEYRKQTEDELTRLNGLRSQGPEFVGTGEIQKIENKLDAKELQTLIVGFESYNKSVKVLLDMCGNVESENDFRLLGLLITESGEDFIENTSDYGAIKDKLMSEGYGDHPELGPLMNQSTTLVGLMTTCMDILAWEFSG